MHILAIIGKWNPKWSRPFLRAGHILVSLLISMLWFLLSPPKRNNYCVKRTCGHFAFNTLDSNGWGGGGPLSTVGPLLSWDYSTNFHVASHHTPTLTPSIPPYPSLLFPFPMQPFPQCGRGGPGWAQRVQGIGGGGDEIKVCDGRVRRRWPRCYLRSSLGQHSKTYLCHQVYNMATRPMICTCTYAVSSPTTPSVTNWERYVGRMLVFHVKNS